MDDFRKYATKHLGMNGMVLDDVINSTRRFLPFDDGPHHFPWYTS